MQQLENRNHTMQEQQQCSLSFISAAQQCVANFHPRPSFLFFC